MSTCSDTSYITTDSMLGEILDSSGKHQMHWKLFRKDVLAPHHIRILETNPGLQLPDAVIESVNANRDNVARFNRQRKHFRKQVAEGRGFGDSALFPHEVLPSTKGQPFIAKCMIPIFSAEPLPDRKVRDAGSLGLSPPRPAFACGFSSSAFGPEELRSIPNFLETSGTTLEFDTGSITPNSALYCPFMTFERTSDQKHGLEIAENYCAINGAWAIRSLQMLHTQVDSSPIEDPVSFTCAIDNTMAILNYHWMDHAHTYCMAPMIKFELSRDDHFNQFLIWIEAIGSWAVSSILPEVKKAISLINEDSQDLALIKSVKVSQNTMSLNEHSLFSALKLSYHNVPWNLKDDTSAVSSSTASWGSPMINEAVFSNIKYPINIQPSYQPIRQLDIPNISNTSCSEPSIIKSVRFANSTRAGILKPAASEAVSPESKSTTSDLSSNDEVAFETNTELLMKRRLSHAMDEIKDLHKQLNNMKAEFSGSTMSLQNELSGLRKSMTTVLRKERLSFKQGSVRSVPERLDTLQSEKRVKFEQVSIITTPTDPSARPMWQRANAPRRSSGLQNVLALDTRVSTSVSTSRATGNVKSESPTSITIFSPTIINVSTNEAWGESVEEVDGENYDDLIRVPPRSNTLSPALVTNLFCALVPSVLLRVLFLGFLVDYCMVSMNGHQVQSLSHYLSLVLETGITI